MRAKMITFLTVAIARAWCFLRESPAGSAPLQGPHFSGGSSHFGISEIRPLGGEPIAFRPEVRTRVIRAIVVSLLFMDIAYGGIPRPDH